MKELNINSLLNLELINNETIYVYSKHNSIRLNYTCQFIFNHVLKCNFKLITSINDFENYKGPKINYSLNYINASINIPESEFLNNACPINNKLNIEIENTTKFILFKNENINFEFNFDLFSAVFACISRYEEWVNTDFDNHNRFEIKSSIFYKNNCHLEPIVDEWIMQLKKIIEKKYNCNLCNNSFKQISTIDIDNLYAYKHKGFVRNFGGLVKDLFKLKFKLILQRISVCLNITKDPFDVYEQIIKYLNNTKTDVVFFYLLNTGNTFDRTLNPLNKAFKENIKKISKLVLTGLHPSYYSSIHKEILNREVNLFKELTGNEVKISRQHYLKFDIKSTPNWLQNNNIQADFTMGFASKVGFRAGTSYPFYYFDFKTNMPLKLLAVPFCAMDGAYTIYESTQHDNAIKQLLQLKDKVKNVGGLFITVFHERTFSTLHYNNASQLFYQLYNTNCN